MLPLAYYGNPILRMKAKPIEMIDEEILQLVKEMEEAMKKHNGIGIAAPQVCRSLRLFLVRAPIKNELDEWVDGPIEVFINPQLSQPSEETWIREEGCLSIPKIYGNVERPLCITVEATDLEGNRFTRTCSGLEARIIMHENDHINGVLFIDRMDKEERKQIEQAISQIKKTLGKKG